MVVKSHSVLFGFWNNLASHLERSPLKRSYGYAPAADRPTCFCQLAPRNPNPGEKCGLDGECRQKLAYRPSFAGP